MTKVEELEGKELDEWVAKALGYQGSWQIPYDLCGTTYCGESDGYINDWNPSEDWYQAGPIIQRERIGFYEASYRANPDIPPKENEQTWSAAVDGHPNYESYFDNEYHGKTPLIAAMKAFVASKFGDEI